jgi:hypothetical protein
MKLQRYDIEAWPYDAKNCPTDCNVTKHDDGEWAKADEALAEIAAKDKEIEGLKSGITQIIWEVKAGATDVEVLAICRKMLGIEEST